MVHVSARKLLRHYLPLTIREPRRLFARHFYKVKGLQVAAFYACVHVVFLLALVVRQSHFLRDFPVNPAPGIALGLGLPVLFAVVGIMLGLLAHHAFDRPVRVGQSLNLIFYAAACASPLAIVGILIPMVGLTALAGAVFFGVFLIVVGARYHLGLSRRQLTTVIAVPASSMAFVFAVVFVVGVRIMSTPTPTMLANQALMHQSHDNASARARFLGRVQDRVRATFPTKAAIPKDQPSMKSTEPTETIAH